LAFTGAAKIARLACELPKPMGEWVLQKLRLP